MSLIRRVDALVARGVGGFGDRAELIKEAIEAMVLELAIDRAPDLLDMDMVGATGPELSREESMRVLLDRSEKGPPREHPARRPFTPSSRMMALVGGEPEREAVPPDLGFTRLTLNGRGRIAGPLSGAVRSEPMFGLHNRDYPSFWAAHRIVEMTQNDLIEWEFELRRHLLEQAWRFGEWVKNTEQGDSRKLSALFPTNKEKRPSAEDGFMNFAVGTLTEKEGSVHLSGPLFLWEVIGFERRDGKFHVGITEEGYRLLEDLEGLSLELPHPQPVALKFFEHVKRKAPSDLWGFRTVLEVIGEGITRTHLIEAFHHALIAEFPRDPDEKPWSPVQAATDTAGYVARAREWGLIEPKQFRGRYLLTNFGRDFKEQLN